MKLNYELIYKLRKHRIDSYANIEVGYLNEARAKARKEFDKTLAAIEKAIGHSNFEMTSIVCSADGIGCHVYARPDGNLFELRAGLGERVCIFCGCNDFDY